MTEATDSTAPATKPTYPGTAASFLIITILGVLFGVLMWWVLIAGLKDSPVFEQVVDEVQLQRNSSEKASPLPKTWGDGRVRLEHTDGKYTVTMSTWDNCYSVAKSFLRTFTGVKLNGQILLTEGQVRESCEKMPATLTVPDRRPGS
ncbi:hypothetical protein HNP46_000432 [Pseudomonas nitritireducens]|uniref:Uncharacterized protein n=1 Tax=Pseudomonas nitroreducens TaxID=46680 RepID=A0A7W7NYN0_PSENT|nr:hypothetical protein [Pseudomonas nitritireducens]MBB4861621.1 hypothetical protein [Pseudomonas nitritireducens]